MVLTDEQLLESAKKHRETCRERAKKKKEECRDKFVHCPICDIDINILWESGHLKTPGHIHREKMILIKSNVFQGNMTENERYIYNKLVSKKDKDIFLLALADRINKQTSEP